MPSSARRRGGRRGGRGSAVEMEMEEARDWVELALDAIAACRLRRPSHPRCRGVERGGSAAPRKGGRCCCRACRCCAGWEVREGRPPPPVPSPLRARRPDPPPAAIVVVVVPVAIEEGSAAHGRSGKAAAAVAEPAARCRAGWQVGEGRRRRCRACRCRAAPARRAVQPPPLPLRASCDHAEILAGAGQVCRSWRRAARDEPDLWRRIDMRGRGHGHAGAGLRGMAQAAVSRSKGQCEAFRSQHAVDDGFLLFLGET
uniref:F-box domain-containing protein n=1 Tax=Oryza sativa subsp. japonica TaxID=39947 RepID=Q6Z074_ORYSJ|nr:hypothetical protein [Oryza sativa Japonica Group]BAD03682.1 hypothetical protein [Oryza sativa Japonica Group]